MTVPLRIGTRGSRLALWQADFIADRLRPLAAPRPIELVEIETAGDQVRDVPLAQLGGERRPEPRALEAQRKQWALARVGLGHRRQHPGGHVRRLRAELAAFDNEHGQPARPCAPRDGQADDAAADDRYVVAVVLCGNRVSSRFAGMTRISS